MRIRPQRQHSCLVFAVPGEMLSNLHFCLRLLYIYGNLCPDREGKYNEMTVAHAGLLYLVPDVECRACNAPSCETVSSDEVMNN